MFIIDSMSRQPVYEQIIRQLERFVLTGMLKPGDQLPSVRSLSMTLSINPNTIQKAYAELDFRGIIYSVPGRGCFVSENAETLLTEYKRGQLRDIEALARELAEAGIPRQDVLDSVNAAYDQNQNAHAEEKGEGSRD